MCKSIYVQTNSNAIGYWQEHWACVYLKREGGAILMLPFFLFHFCLGTRPGEGRSRACWSNLWKGKWGCEFYLTHVSFSPSVPSHDPFEQSEHGIHLRSPLERWNSSRISKEEKDFFQFITSYNQWSMLFHNRNQIVNLYWCISSWNTGRGINFGFDRQYPSSLSFIFLT